MTDTTRSHAPTPAEAVGQVPVIRTRFCDNCGCMISSRAQHPPVFCIPGFSHRPPRRPRGLLGPALTEALIAHRLDQAPEKPRAAAAAVRAAGRAALAAARERHVRSRIRCSNTRHVLEARGTELVLVAHPQCDPEAEAVVGALTGLHNSCLDRQQAWLRGDLEALGRSKLVWARQLGAAYEWDDAGADLDEVDRLIGAAVGPADLADARRFGLRDEEIAGWRRVSADWATIAEWRAADWTAGEAKVLRHHLTAAESRIWRQLGLDVRRVAYARFTATAWPQLDAVTAARLHAAGISVFYGRRALAYGADLGRITRLRAVTHDARMATELAARRAEPNEVDELTARGLDLGSAAALLIDELLPGQPR